MAPWRISLSAAMGPLALKLKGDSKLAKPHVSQNAGCHRQCPKFGEVLTNLFTIGFAGSGLNTAVTSSTPAKDKGVVTPSTSAIATRWMRLSPALHKITPLTRFATAIEGLR